LELEARVNILFWAIEERKKREQFIAWWMKERESDPEMFVLEMDPGDWDEQFNAWLEGDGE
jgi:hypothetical protein